MDYFMSDTHFFDTKIIMLANRPYDDIEIMHNDIIEKWNNKVDINDTVYFLGDVANFRDNQYGSKDNRMELIKNIITRLNGVKVLIMGNHDDWATKEEWLNMGFDTVIEYPIVYQEFIILSHSPLFINETTPFVNLFGHVHNNPIYKDFSFHHFCVCVERINYTPISFNEIKQIISNNK